MTEYQAIADLSRLVRILAAYADNNVSDPEAKAELRAVREDAAHIAARCQVAEQG